jgi:glycosyltransferase involved in cell wall biosynthesis
VKKQGRISLVLPASNEEENIASVIGSASSVLGRISEDYEIIVVNDGSTDRTLEILGNLARDDSRIHVFSHDKRLGYGASLKRGLQKASAELVCFSDADQQFDLSELPLLLEWIPEFDIVAGYRKKRLDGVTRRAIAWGWSRIVRLFFGLAIRDVDCAFKAFRKEVLDTIPIASMGAFVNTEILVRARKRGFTIKEVAVTHYPRRFGKQTGAHPRVIVKALTELLKLRKEIK